MPSVAVIMPAYMQNDQHIAWLQESIQSVKAQTFTDWELIIVDDCSPVAIDGPAQGQIRLLHHDRRRGAGAARNTAIAATEAPYILCLDADDKLKLDALQKLWDARCPNGVVYGDLEYIGTQSGVHQLPDWSLELLIRATSPLAITALHPRAAWRAVGGFDESLPGLEDVDYWTRLAERHCCGRRIPQIIFEYRRHADSRQAGLEANSAARMRQVREVLMHRHRKVASNMVNIIKGCSKCPGSGGIGTGVNNVIPPEVGSNTVRLRYVGPMQGSFVAHGFTTGAKYFISGRGDTTTVDVRDADALLARATGGRRDFEQIDNLPPAPVPVETAAILAALDNPPSSLSSITSLTVKDAQAMIDDTSDLPDLRVWLAEERASDKPRKTIIAVLEARISELSEPAGQDG